MRNVMVHFETRCGCSKETNYVCDEEPAFIDLPMLPAAGPKALPEGTSFAELAAHFEARRFERTFRNSRGVMVYTEKRPVTTPGGPFDQAVAAELAKLKKDAEDLADAIFVPLLDLLRDGNFRGFDFLDDEDDEES